MRIRIKIIHLLFLFMKKKKMKNMIEWYKKCMMKVKIKS